MSVVIPISRCSKVRRLSLIGLNLFVLAGLGCGDLKRIDETVNQSYERYKKGDFSAWLDPRGASNIDTCCSYYGDGYEAWWRFVVSEQDFETIVSSTAMNDGRGDNRIFEPFSALPPNWKPYAEPPTWWDIQTMLKAKSTHWCCRVGDGERRRGWLFLYSSDAKVAYVWHWNHQWAESECSAE